MVNFCLRSSFISSLVLLLLLFVVFSHAGDATKVVDVSVICNQTENPPFCTKFLNSIPGGAIGKDFVTVAQYSIDVVRKNITNSISLIKSLISQYASDAKKKEHYELCLRLFKENARHSLEQAQEDLKSGDYLGVNSGASGVCDTMDLCVTNYSMTPGEPPYQDSSLLPKYAHIIDNVMEITLVISSILSKK